MTTAHTYTALVAAKSLDATSVTIELDGGSVTLPPNEALELWDNDFILTLLSINFTEG